MGFEEKIVEGRPTVHELLEKIKIKEDEIKALKNELQKVGEKENHVNLEQIPIEKVLKIVGHDLKSPFNIIINYTDLLIEQYCGDVSETVMQVLKIINKESKLGFSLLDSLLLWTQTSTRQIPCVPVDVHINKVILNTMLMFVGQAEKKGVDIKTSIPNDLIIKVDINIFSTIIRNLISNAVKFSFPKGTIFISASQSDKKIHLQVKDHGVGIAARKLESIFSIGTTKSTPGTNNEKGHGYGLPLVYKLVELVGAQIQIDSRESVGTTINLFFPQNE